MKLFIKKESSIAEVQNVFTTYYPYLKLELYKMPVINNYTAAKKESLPFNFQLQKFLSIKEKTIIDMDNDITVATLEYQFKEIGLVAEVFRRSGNVWVATSLTTNWTLQQQNMEGEEISKHFTDKKIASSC